MLNRVTFIAIVLCLIWWGCQKNASLGDDDIITIPDSLKKPTYKIELLDGLNQTDTAGHVLKTPIKVKVYKNNVPFTIAKVNFICTGCNAPYSIVGNYINQYAPNIGESTYSWALNEKLGLQTLKIVLCDLQNNPLDSVKITATAIEPKGNGFHLSACGGGSELDRTRVLFTKLKSGRIISLYNSSNGDYAYSDDNGLSWYTKQPFTGNFPRKIVAAPNGNVYMLTDAIVNDYIYRSKDEGDTWQQIFKSEINEELEDINFGSEGKIICTTTGLYLYTSVDDGKTWRRGGVFLAHNNNVTPSYITTTTSGKVLMIGSKGSLLQSANFGATWTAVNENELFEPFESYELGTITSIYKDDKDEVYIGRSFPVPGIYKLNAGYNIAKRINFGNDIFEDFKRILKISHQKDGYYYFYIALKGLYRTKDFVTYEDLSKKYKLDVIDYIVADNKNLIVASGQYGKTYYLKQ